MHHRCLPPSAPAALPFAGLALAAALALALPAPEAHAQQAPPAAPAACPALLQKSFDRLQDEKPQNLCQYSGKVLLVVNTASYCGFTPQYQGLEKLHADYSAQGLVVLGFPSNDFGQEKADSKEIADFCFNTYGVKFPMFAPSSVTGAKANPLYAELIKATGKSPAWNFNKYLVDRQGKVLAYYPSNVTPEGAQLQGDIRKALAAR